MSQVADHSRPGTLVRTAACLVASLATALAAWFTLRPSTWGTFELFRPGTAPGIGHRVVATLEPSLCREMSDLRMLRHAAQTIRDGIMLVNGAAAASLALREVKTLEASSHRRLLWSALFLGHHEVHAGPARAKARPILADPLGVAAAIPIEAMRSCSPGPLPPTRHG